MKKCPACGFENQNSLPKCVMCFKDITEVEHTAPTKQTQLPQKSHLADFNGWILFFTIVNFTAMATGSLKVYHYSKPLASSLKNADPLAIILSLEWIIMIAGLVYTFKIISTVRQQQPETPAKIAGFLKKQIVVSALLLLMVLLKPLFYGPYELDLNGIIAQLITAGLYYIWIHYFRKSERAKMYYGIKE